ncbi:MAG TPA: hypothetical protein VGP47_07575 [Parachlamydiaceae bacterium]|nr:hypothetical protein [Parachlamydiaceae bacterium]
MISNISNNAFVNSTHIDLMQCSLIDCNPYLKYFSENKNVLIKNLCDVKFNEPQGIALGAYLNTSIDNVANYPVPFLKAHVERATISDTMIDQTSCKKMEFDNKSFQSTFYIHSDKEIKINNVNKNNLILESAAKVGNSFFNYLKSGKQQLIDFYEFAPTFNEIASSVLRTVFVERISAAVIRLNGDMEDFPSYVPKIVAGIYGLTLEFYPKIYLYQLRKLTQDQTKKNVVLICLAVSDWNGAIHHIRSIETFKKLSSTHSIVLKDVNDVGDINEQIDRITSEGRKIFATFIMGHGLPTEILLGADSLVSEQKDEEKGSWFSSNKKWIGHLHFSKLEPNGHIVLDSCSTGARLPYPTMNIAEQVQYYAGPTIKVHAADAPHSGLYFDTDFNTRFEAANKANISYEEAAKKYQALNSLIT